MLPSFQNQVAYHIVQYVPKTPGDFKDYFNISDSYKFMTHLCIINIYFHSNDFVLLNILAA
jgi:hypothetical protein